MSKNVNNRSDDQVAQCHDNDYRESEKPQQQPGLPSRPLLLTKEIHAPVLTQTTVIVNTFAIQLSIISSLAQKFSFVRPLIFHLAFSAA
ncbi:MAG: hypothetical protein QOD03_1487 [Verrucomicrobiota bacterium]